MTDFSKNFDIGRQGEEEVADILNSRGFNVRVGKPGGYEPDILGLRGIHVEVKHCKDLKLYDFMKQSKNDASITEYPIVCFKRNSTPNAEWVVIQPIHDWLDLYDDASEAISKKTDVLDVSVLINSKHPDLWYEGVANCGVRLIARGAEITSYEQAVEMYNGTFLSK